MAKVLIGVIALLIIAGCGESSQASSVDDVSHQEWLAFCTILLDDMDEAIVLLDRAETMTEVRQADTLYELADKYYVDNDCPE